MDEGRYFINPIRALALQEVLGLSEAVEGKNGLCKKCNNLTCKRNKEKYKKDCNIFMPKPE